MNRKLAWGILGTGNIARQFCAGLAQSQTGDAMAVGSRSQSSADEFAKMFAVPQALGSYQALLDQSHVDVIYVSLPNSMHREWTIKALRAGKHVLCEKPIAMNAAEAEEMFDEAQKAGRLLIEAFMYRSHPQTLAVEEVLRSGVIGELNLIRTSFCYRTRGADANIRFNPALGGGALMDIGCYCANFSRHFAGSEPTAIQCAGHVNARGVDDLAGGTMRFSTGLIATFSCGMMTQANNAAYLCGSEGYIEIPVPWKPTAMNATFTTARQTPPKMDGGGGTAPPRETRTINAGTELFAIEADDFAAAVSGKSPPRISATDSIGNMVVLDEMRKQIGVPF